ncbi:MAG: LysR family transcriptional regulator [Clostridiales bacterium]|nr:LysR family transcriptional regulator [Clostridiales bacterium]
MNDRQIKCFLEAARTLNFTKAAENLCLPQQALSRYISSLEAELDTLLFIRKNTRNIFLSESGKAFFNLFQRFEVEFENTRSKVKASDPQQVVFGYNTGWNLSFMMPQVFAKCREQMPNLNIILKCMGLSELIDSLYSHKVDAVLTIADYPEHYPELIREPVTEIHRIVLYSDLLATSKLIHSPADLYDQKFFILDDIYVRQMMKKMESYFESYHFVPQFQAADNFETIIANVENGLGVTMMDEWVYNILAHPSIHYVKMNSYHTISFVWHRDSNNAGIPVLREAVAGYFHEK